MATTRKYGTCFFEQYAQITLAALLGSDYEDLVNRDRPDLQSVSGHRLGIEVTRAMEESKAAEKELLKDVAGITQAGPEDEELILESGYAYGLRRRLVGAKEYHYWSTSLTLRRILESKVSKAGNGFYGHYDTLGLFVFCKDQLGEEDARRAMNYALSLQRGLDCRYDLLYLADVDDLFVCNLEDGLKAASRLVRYRITQEQRRTFFLEAVRRQIGKD